MREIKFRMWNSCGERSRFLYSFQALECMNQQQLGIYNHEADGCAFEQYTGLKDKNGKEIYEGDIYLSTYRAGGAGSIRGRSRERVKQVVEWDDRGRWSRNRIEQGRGYGWCHPDCELGEDIIVIGNIHENPELLKG